MSAPEPRPAGDQVADQLRRRRHAALRLPPLPDGRRDPVDLVSTDAPARPVDHPDHDAGERQGLNRVTLARSSSGRCHACERSFETLAGAVSHGKAAGHLVEGTYTASYLYVPRDAGAGR